VAGRLDPDSTTMRRLATLTAIFAVVILSACLEAAPFVPKIDEVGYDPSLGVDLSLSTETESGLWYRDLTAGAGPTVRSDSGGDTVRVRYRGYLRSGFRFDSNTGPGEPVLTFVTRRGDVIDGFDEGVRGMQLGGVRQIIIPPSLGYGNAPNGNIPANSILIFRVEIVDLDTASTS
jgi:FKBP-type peptidyl-prolyl cis-trans isomerase FkpA